MGEKRKQPTHGACHRTHSPAATIIQRMPLRWNSLRV